MGQLAMVLAVLAVGCGRVGFEDATPADGPINCALPSSGLLGYWPMDSVDVAGTELRDHSGNDRHGVLIGSPPPAPAAGKIGEALSYPPASTGYVGLPSLPIDTGPAGFTTVTMWFFETDPDVDSVLVYLPAIPRYDLWLNVNRSGVLSLCFNTGVDDCWGIQDPGLFGRWVHVAAVFAQGRVDRSSLYVDGAPVTVGCAFGDCTGTAVIQAPFTLGGDDIEFAWHGQIDDVRIYDRALGADEVRQIFECR